MKLKIFLLAIAFISLSLNSYGQIKVTGKVTDFNDIPQTDIMVYLDTLKVEANVNNRGYFKVKVPETTKQINIFSPKYGLLSTDYKGAEIMNFVFLDPAESKASKDLVSLDYSDLSSNDETQNSNKVELEGSRDVVGYANIFDYIRGKVPGVRVDQNNRIIIRGVRSVTGSSDPLFVVNGMPVDNIGYIDVNQVKDVKVLKNGTSMYGARGANGVLIVTLRK